MDHVGLLASQTPDTFAVHPDAVGQGRAGARDSHRIQVGELVVPRFPFDGFQLDRRLSGVGVDHRVGLLREVADCAEQLPSAARSEARRVAPAEPAVRPAVPRGAQVGRFLQRVVGRLPQPRRRRRCVHQALARRGAQADGLQRLKGGPGVPNRLHVEDRGRAPEQQFGGAEHRRPVDGVLGMRRLERPDAPG